MISSNYIVLSEQHMKLKVDILFLNKSGYKFDLILLNALVNAKCVLVDQ